MERIKNFEKNYVNLTIGTKMKIYSTIVVPPIDCYTRLRDMDAKKAAEKD